MSGFFVYLVKTFLLLHDTPRRRWVVSVTFKKLRWRGLTAFVAAYALVLQAFLAYGIAAGAAAQNPAAPDSAVFVICSHLDTGTSPDTDKPVVPSSHCPLCTLAIAGVALPPEPAAMPVQLGHVLQRVVPMASAVGASLHRSRAGLSRAPPRNV
jgi:hypothetical protein